MRAEYIASGQKNKALWMRGKKLRIKRDAQYALVERIQQQLRDRGYVFPTRETEREVMPLRREL